MGATDSSAVRIAYRTELPQVSFAVGELEAALRDLGTSVGTVDLQSLSGADPVPRIAVLTGEDATKFGSMTDTDPRAEQVEPEGFGVRRFEVGGETIVAVVASDAVGAMYGTLDLVEQLGAHGRLESVEERVSNPTVPFRAIKFNLPWAPYRDGEQTEIHYETCRDLDFWRSFLDMMARNRFNVLSLWNLHPFPYMVKSEAFPEASPFSDGELAEWKEFWHSLFRMATDRGIETYIVNWNIHTTPEFAEAHDVHQYNDPADVVRDYTRACVTEVIDEYENLTGLGTSVASWMENMEPSAKHDWLEETFLEGIERASRPIKLLHRSIKAQDLGEMRRVIEAEAALENVSEVWVPSKFNWSHGHSTPKLELTHDHKSGEVDDRLWSPEPERYRIAWMVRNEDFFVLRWGDPEYIRDHVETNFEDRGYVGGYFVGSEGYVPAKDISHRVHEHRTWNYAFEKQWLFYLLWGRLLYDPETPDRVFERAFAERYGPDTGEKLLEGYRLASRMPLELASFHAGTWDYTLYAEGFLAPIETLGLDEGESAFISIDELIDHETLDSDYLSIPEFLEYELSDESPPEGAVTPPMLASRLTENGRVVLDIVSSLEADTSYGPLECELLDLTAWAHLSLYFAEKLRGGVEFETYRLTGMNRWKKAVTHLEEAVEHWDAVVDATEDHYRDVPYATDHWPDRKFSWEQYRDQVKRDIEIVRNARPYDYESP